MDRKEPRSLLRTILNRTLPIAVAVFVIAWFIVSSYIGRTIRFEARLRLQENAARASELVAQNLDLQREYAKTLATNELLVNSLVDVQERERYLPLFFRSLKAPGAVAAQIDMTDYRGRNVASNGARKSFEVAEWLPKVMQGKEHFTLSSNGLIIAVPIKYFGKPEGMIVLTYQTDAVRNLLAIELSEYEIAILDGDGSLLSRLSPQIPRRDLHSSLNRSKEWVQYRTRLDRYPNVQMVALQSTAREHERVLQAGVYLLTASALSVFALIIGTVLTARTAVAPLSTLLEKIDSTCDADDFSEELEVQGAFEFRSLAFSFNQMMVRLRQTTVSRDHLETLNKVLQDQAATIESANAQLGKSNEELRQFAYVASHDLQEPLRKVIAFCQILKDEYNDKLDENAQTYIRYAVDGATRMRTLIVDLLDYSRVESQGKPLAPTNASEAIDVAIEILHSSIKESDTQIHVEPMPIILADKTQLIRLFQNLISNAIKYRSEKPPLIQVNVLEEPSEWVLSFQDNGIGIEPQCFDQIFVMFQRLHARDEYAGTGIGLAICKRIVDRLHGRIWVESEVGVGSNFFIAVPKLNTVIGPDPETMDHKRGAGQIADVS